MLKNMKLISILAFGLFFLIFSSMNVEASIFTSPDAEVEVIGFPLNSNANGDNFFTVVLMNKDASTSEDSINKILENGILLELDGGIFQSLENINCDRCFNGYHIEGALMYVGKDFLAEGDSAIGIIKYRPTKESGTISLKATGMIKDKDEDYTDYHTITTTSTIINPNPTFSVENLADMARQRGEFYNQSSNLLNNLLADQSKIDSHMQEAWTSSMYWIMGLSVQVITMSAPTTAQGLFKEGVTSYYDPISGLTDYQLESTFLNINKVINIIFTDYKYRVNVIKLQSHLNIMKTMAEEEAGYWESRNLTSLRTNLGFGKNEMYATGDIIADSFKLIYQAENSINSGGEDADFYALQLAKTIKNFTMDDQDYIDKMGVALDDDNFFTNFEANVNNPPKPLLIEDITAFTLEPNLEKDITVKIQNIGGPTDIGYLDITVSSGLDVISWSSTSLGYDNRGPNSEDPNLEMWDINGGLISPSNELISLKDSYNSNEEKTFNVRIKANGSGAQWLKYRISMNYSDGGVFIRHPTSGTTDQQGGYAIEVPITISTIKYPPEAFALYNPGDTTPSDSYVIKWSKAAGATNYILDEALSNSFSSPDEIYSGTSTFKSITKTVDGTYYYRVKACNSDGCNESNIVNITKMNYPPNIPNNPAPQDSSINQPINPTLSWDGGDPNGDYVIYTVSLDSSSNPITEVCSTLTSCYISGLEHDTTYYWKVVASDGKLSETSPVWSFTTKPLTVCPSGCGYTSIQKAVYSAKKGDTIRVYSGIYFENVVINSLYNENYQITLKGIDSGDGMPVIDAGGTTKSALKLSGSQIEVDGFIITNATLGDSNYGIEVNSCSNCTINNNTVINNRRGIGVVFSNNVTLEGNVVNDNEYFGVSVIQSENNTIIDNTANNNSVYAYGIMISSSINNLIENNTFNDNSWYGIALNGGSNNNIITKNNINNNYQGIGLENSNDNIIFFNNFVDNSIDVKSTNSENMWNSTLKIRYILNNSIFNNYLGNYFSTYSDPDSNGDGIGDTSYGRENYPLFHQFEEYVIPILVCPSKCGHTSIQGAIYSAKIKDTIVVLSGIYNENVNVNKHITIWGLDTGGGKPVVDAGGTQNSAIKLSVDGITVKGLKVTNSTGYTGGISITSKNNNVKDNDAIENYYGISIYSPGSNNTLMGNNIVNSSNGYGAGIYIWSNNNSIIMNTIKNYYYGNGISVGNSKYNKIYGNNVSSNRNGIRLYWYSDYNTLIDNNASNNKYGISFEDSSFNTLQKNKVTSNNYGIYIENYLSNSNNNTLYQNNITENRDMFSEISNVFDEGNNNWDNGTIGNLYSDFDTSDEGCNDIDINGICDSNYSIPGGLNVDRYPIALWQNKDIIFPASIKNLKNTTYKQTYINWTWNNPSDSDFNYTMVYLNSTFVANVSEEFFNATGLNADTEYTIGTRTVDTTGNINATWVNHTARTKVKGDFNNNGRVDIGDVAKVAYMVVDKVADDMGADFNGNGRVDIGDAAKIAYYLVGKVSEL